MHKGWESILLNTNTVVFLISGKGVLQSLSPNVEKITGVSPMSFCGKHIFRFLDAREREKIKQELFGLQAAAQSIELEMEIKLRNKKYLKGLVSFSRDEEGFFSGTITPSGVQQDLETDRFQQQEIIRSTLESIDDLVFVTDHKGVFTECYTGSHPNDVFFSSDLFVGKNFEEVGFPADVSEKFFKALNKARIEKKTQQIEYSLEVFGSEFFYQAKLSPRFSSMGDFEGITAVCRDISSLKKFEKEILRSRDFYLTILQKFPTLIWRAGKDKKLDFFNDTYLDFTGRSLQEEQNFGWLEQIHPEDQEYSLKIYKDAFDKKVPFRMEYRLRHRSGKYRWVLDVGRPLFNMENQFAGYLGSCMDIHEEKSTRKMLVESEERYRSMVESHADLVCRWKPDATLTFVNKPFAEFYGKRPESLIGEKWLEFLSSTRQKRRLRALKKLQTTPKKEIREYSAINKDGKKCWHHWVNSPIFDGDGNLVEFQSVGRDITSRKLQEEEKEVLLLALNRKVRELTFFNNFSSLIQDRKLTLTEMFEYVVNTLPDAFQNPEKTFVKISIGEINICSPEFTETPDCIHEKIDSMQFGSGKIQVCFSPEQHQEKYRNSEPWDEKILLSIVADLLNTHIKKAEAETMLATSEKKFRELFENITDIVFLTDAKGRFKSMNPAGTLKLGYRQWEKVSLYNVVAPSSLPALREAFTKAVRNNQTSFTIETDLVTAKGNILNFEVNCMIRFSGGEAYEIFGVARDVTESKQLSKRLMKAIVETEEKERRRFAEELHDGLGPLLSGIRLYLQKADVAWDLPEKEKRVLKYCNELANDAISQTRTIANNLMPNVLADFGLVRALKSFISKINELGKIQIKLATNEENIDLQPVEYTIIYRVITELINNSLKHSSGKNVSIDLHWVNNILKIKYHDDGKGFDPDALIKHPGNKGMGLKNIINRIKSINGSLEFNKGNTSGFSAKILITAGQEVLAEQALK